MSIPKRRVYSTVLIGPESEHRKQRRARRKAAAQIQAKDVAARKAEARAATECGDYA